MIKKVLKDLRLQNIFRIWSSVLTKLMTIVGSVGKWKVVGGSLDQWSMGQRSVDLIKRNRCNFNGLFNANLSSVLNLIFIKSLPYSPFLPPFIVSISFLIPFQSSVYFFNTSLFSSVESKTKYLLLFFPSICPSTLPIIWYKGFRL